MILYRNTMVLASKKGCAKHKCRIQFSESANPLRRLALGVLAGVLLAAIGIVHSASAQGGSPKVVRIIVPFAPGAAVDFIGRLLAETMKAQTGQTVIVENKPGARTYIGAEEVARSKPDGGAILISVDDTFTMVPHLTKRKDFNPMKQLVPINILGTISMVMVVNPSLPVNSLPSFIDYVKAHPKSVSYSSSGVGSATQLAMEMLKSRAKINLVHVPYRGLTPAATAVMTNEVQASVLGYGTSRALIEAGKLKAIAITSPDRIQSLPNVPTTHELGYPKVYAAPRLVLSVSAKTPPAILRGLEQTIARVLENPGLRKTIESRYIVVTSLGISKSEAKLKELSEMNAAAMRVAGVQAE